MITSAKELLDAIKNNRVELFRKSLEPPSTLNINERYLGITPLFFSVLHEKVEFVRLLIDHPRIDVNIECELRDVQTCEYVRGNKIYHQWTYYIGDTPLTLACRSKNIEIIRLLLNHPRIDVNKTFLIDYWENIRRVCPFGLSISLLGQNQKIQVEIVKLFLKKLTLDINARSENKSPLFHSINFKDPEVLYQHKGNDVFDLLLNDPRIKYQKYGFLNHSTSVYRACENGNLYVLKKLIERFGSDSKVDFFDLNEGKYKKDGGDLELTPLYISIVKRHFEITKFLLRQPGVDVSLGGKAHPLYYASVIGSVEIVRLLLVHPTMKELKYCLPRNPISVASTLRIRNLLKNFQEDREATVLSIIKSISKQKFRKQDEVERTELLRELAENEPDFHIKLSNCNLESRKVFFVLM